MSNREFIMNERAVDYYGADTMAAINSRSLPRFADGGSLAAVPTLRRIPSGEALGRGAGRMQVDLRAKVDASPLLLASVEETAIRTVSASADPIMEGAKMRTMREINRDTLPGGYG